MSYAIGFFVYGFDTTPDGMSSVIQTVMDAIMEDPAQFELDVEQAKQICDPYEPALDQLRTVLTDVLNCWTTYRDRDPVPVALGVELGSFDECSSFSVFDLLKLSAVSDEDKQNYEEMLDRLPAPLCRRFQEMKPEVLVLWGSS